MQDIQCFLFYSSFFPTVCRQPNRPKELNTEKNENQAFIWKCGERTRNGTETDSSLHDGTGEEFLLGTADSIAVCATA